MKTFEGMAKRHALILLAIALLAFVSYLPTLTRPLIEDDYPNILLSRTYGPVGGWAEMARDSIQRVRATTFVLSHWIEHLFGLRPVAFYAVSILLHVCNCWLLYALGRWRVVGFRVSAWGAAFFAIYEGHQEAVMWYSACSELLLFFFGILSLLCWLIFLERERPRLKWYVLSLCFFVLALLSKESSIIFVLLLALPLLDAKRTSRRTVFLIPYAVLSLAYALLIFQTRNSSFRFQDGSFDLSAPFWITWSKSFVALFWFWGLLAVCALVVGRRSRRLLRFALVWIGISFMP